MMRLFIAAVLVVLTAPPAAAQSKKMTGISLMLVGAGLTAAAFDYRGDVCPPGYSTHTYQNLPTQCVYVSRTPPYDSDVREATIKVRLKRRGLLWSGLGAVGVGTVLMLFPEPVRRVAPDVTALPAGWRAAKTFGW